MIRLLIAAVAAGVLLFAGGYLYGRSDGKKRCEVERAIWRQAHDAQVAETRRIENEWRVTKEQENEWREKAETAAAGARDVARRLREFRARLGTLPEAASPAGESGSPGEESSGIGGIEERYFEACALDAADYDSLVDWYRALRNAQ
jgi:hypothetical protein